MKQTSFPFRLNIQTKSIRDVSNMKAESVSKITNRYNLPSISQFLWDRMGIPLSSLDYKKHKKHGFSYFNPNVLLFLTTVFFIL